MAKIGYAILISMLAIAFAVCYGCAKEPEKPGAVVEEEVVEEVEVPALEPGTEPAADTSSANGDVTAALASLSEADRTAVLAQKTCPVSDEALGSSEELRREVVHDVRDPHAAPRFRHRTKASP